MRSKVWHNTPPVSLTLLYLISSVRLRGIFEIWIRSARAVPANSTKGWGCQIQNSAPPSSSGTCRLHKILLEPASFSNPNRRLHLRAICKYLHFLLTSKKVNTYRNNIAVVFRVLQPLSFYFCYWSVIAVWGCARFCCLMKWIGCMHTYSSSSWSLPPDATPPGPHRAPSWAPHATASELLYTPQCTCVSAPLSTRPPSFLLCPQVHALICTPSPALEMGSSVSFF